MLPGYRCLYAKMKTTILCQSVNLNILSNVSYIEVYRHINVKMYWVCTLLVCEIAQQTRYQTEIKNINEHI